MEEIEKRLAAAEARDFAQGCIARMFIAAMYKERPAELAKLRADVCGAIERLYAERGVTTTAHWTLQMALVEAEALLGPVGKDLPRHDL